MGYVTTVVFYYRVVYNMGKMTAGGRNERFHKLECEEILRFAQDDSLTSDDTFGVRGKRCI
jgi:hypothetical protein